jgi:hypothetical protein
MASLAAPRRRLEGGPVDQIALRIAANLRVNKGKINVPTKTTKSNLTLSTK